MKRQLVLFGVRSPLLPDYEDCCGRADIEIVAAVRADDLRPRLLDRSKLTDNRAFDNEEFIACAFSPKRRQELVDMAMQSQLTAATAVIDTSSIVPASTRIGSGTFINASVTVGSAGVIGDHVFLNRATNVGHHAFIERFTSIGPGCTLAGNVHLGECSFVGAGSVILPGVKIGAGAVVAAGSVVRNDVAPGVLVAGAPAVTKSDVVRPDIYGRDGEE